MTTEVGKTVARATNDQFVVFSWQLPVKNESQKLPDFHRGSFVLLKLHRSGLCNLTMTAIYDRVRTVFVTVPGGTELDKSIENLVEGRIIG